MKFTILLKLTAFAMLATSSSVYASEDHTVQHSLRGSILDEDSTADEELYYKTGDWGQGWGRYIPGNNDGGSSCCGVPAGGTCTAPYKSTTNSVVMNGLEFCCLNPQNVVVSNDTPMCKGSARAPLKPKAPQGAVSCIRRGSVTTCPNNNMDMTIDGRGCTCTPSSARKSRARMPRKQPRQLHFPTRAPRTQRWSAKCNVVNNAMNRAMGCLNVGDDQSTCEACGCRYVAFTRMCVK